MTGSFADELRLDDLPHRIVEPAGRVEQDHERVVVGALGDPVVQPLLRDRVHLGVERDGEHLAVARERLRRRDERDEQWRKEEKALHVVRIPLGALRVQDRLGTVQNGVEL